MIDDHLLLMLRHYGMSLQKVIEIDYILRLVIVKDSVIPIAYKHKLVNAYFIHTGRYHVF